MVFTLRFRNPTGNSLMALILPKKILAEWREASGFVAILPVHRTARAVTLPM